MKRILGMLLVVSLLGGCSITKKISIGGKGLNVKSYLEKNVMNKKQKGSVVAKIEGVPITLQQVRDEMKFSLSLDYNEGQVEKLLADPELRKNYENKIINQHLIIKKMLKGNDFDSEDFKRQLDISIKEAIVKYYMYKTFFGKEENKKWKDLMVTSDEEVLNFYNENKNFFDEKNVKQEDALYAIKTDLDQRKNQLFMSELVKFQSNMIEELKTEYKVEMINN